MCPESHVVVNRDPVVVIKILEILFFADDQFLTRESKHEDDNVSRKASTKTTMSAGSQKDSLNKVVYNGDNVVVANFTVPSTFFKRRCSGSSCIFFT